MIVKVLEAKPDRAPLSFDEGHPWHGLDLRPAWVRYLDEDGETRLSWRPHYPEAWPEDERGAPLRLPQQAAGRGAR